jgi:hypothetical protein
MYERLNAPKAVPFSMPKPYPLFVTSVVGMLMLASAVCFFGLAFFGLYVLVKFSPGLGTAAGLLALFFACLFTEIVHDSQYGLMAYLERFYARLASRK